MTVGLRALLVAVPTWAALAPAVTEAQEEPVATRTEAGRGLAWGSVVGSVLGGLSLGVLSAGLCDSGNCDGSFLEGFFPGVFLGSAAGGLMGLVVGAGVPDEGRAVGGWSWTARAGLRGAGAADISGVGPVMDLYGLRSITDRTRFGIALEYLGESGRRTSVRVRTPNGGFVERTEVQELHVAGVRLLGARLLGRNPRSGGYLVGRVGLHPTWERKVRSAAGPYDEHTSSSFVLVPGGGVGVGFLVPVGDHWAVDFGMQGDAIVGLGGSGILPMAQFAIGLRRDG